jgi:hypothetical protein
MRNALSPKADIGKRRLDVRFVPIADFALIRSARPQAIGTMRGHSAHLRGEIDHELELD